MKKLVFLLIALLLVSVFSSCQKNNTGTNNPSQGNEKIVASSDNFEITASMMEYFANSYYQNWYSQNYYYILLGYINFDPSLPFNDQYTDTTKTQTYYDYFVSGTKVTVETYLKYCEAAKADPSVDYSKLESDAQTYADSSLNQLMEAAKQYSDSYYELYGSRINFDEYLKQNFGKYVTPSTIINALIIEHIASSYYDIIYERINNAVDYAREDKYFEDNLATFVKAEYLVYTLSSLKTVNFPKAEDYIGGVYSYAYNKAIEGKTYEQIMNLNIDPEDYEGGINSVAYQRALEVAQNNKEINEESSKKDLQTIQRLASAKTEEEFKSILLEITNSTNAITKATKSGSYTLTSELGQKLFGGIKSQFGIEYEEYETPSESAKTNDVWCWNNLEININNLERSIKITEVEIAELTTKIATETDADAKATLEVSKKTLEASLETYKRNLELAKETLANAETTGYYSYSVYFVTEAAHRDETKPRNVGHILFKVDSTKDTDPTVSYKTSAEAKAAAQVLLGQIISSSSNGIVSAELFEEFGKSTHESNIFYDDVNKGYMVEEFEDWLFNATIEGEVGLIETPYGWHIMYYGGEAEEVLWRITAKEGAAAEDISAWYEELPSYNISFDDSIFPLIFGIN